MSIKKVLIQKINKSVWWHVQPTDPQAYSKRGKFLASTFLQASFYGRSCDNPSKIQIRNPLFGFSELDILNQIFGKAKGERLLKSISDDDNFYKTRIVLDAKMYRGAQQLGYDAIILMTASGKSALQKGRKPKSIELNLINI